jgi:hypothetical protein
MSNQAPHNAPPACPEFERLLLLFAWDDLDVAQRADVEEHVAHCAACSAALAQERRLLEMLAHSPSADPSELFLASCRRTLAESIDRSAAEIGWRGRLRRVLAGVRPAAWVSLHPAWSAAVLLLAGFAVGRVVSQILTPAPTPTAQVHSSSEMEDWEVTGIHQLADNRLEVDMNTQRPEVVRGTPADARVRRALVSALSAGRGEDADIRMDSVELLRPLRSDNDVRKALCQAARHDANTSVRLKAIEALRGMEQDELVRDTLLDALLHDGNPGVRVEAVTALRAFLDANADDRPFTDERVTQALHDRREKDPNEFVRLQSAAAIRQIAARKAY